MPELVPNVEVDEEGNIVTRDAPLIPPGMVIDSGACRHINRPPSPEELAGCMSEKRLRCGSV